MDKIRKHAFARRRTWTRVETRTLLSFCVNRKDEFTHIHKKKKLFIHLVEDMNSSIVPNVPFTVEEIKNKIKSLKRVYREAIDNNLKTGAAYTIEPFKDLLQELFDKERHIEVLSDSMTISVGVDGAIKTEEISQSGDDELIGIVEDSEVCDYVEPATIPDFKSEPFGSKSIKTRRVLKRDNKSLAERKFDFQREQAVMKQRRHKEKEAARDRRHKELLDYLRTIS